MSSDPGMTALHLLAEPTRRRVYDAVRAADGPQTRDDIANATGINRRLVTFHLDLLAGGGLLDVDYARPPGRGGPGAGRPAKRYRPAPVDIELRVPARRYDLAARILARAVAESTSGGDARERAMQAAHEEGGRTPGGRGSEAPPKKGEKTAGPLPRPEDCPPPRRSTRPSMCSAILVSNP